MRIEKRRKEMEEGDRNGNRKGMGKKRNEMEESNRNGNGKERRKGRE